MALNLQDFLFEYRIEYRKENSSTMSKFKNVSIYPGILDKKKASDFTPREKKHLTRPGFRWYVYYSFKEPGSDKYVRQPPVYGNINRDFSDFDDRYTEVHLLKDGILEGLKRGFSPYDELDEDKLDVNLCLDFALKRKKEEVAKRTYDTYVVHVNKFKRWLKKNGYSNSEPKDITKRILNLFLSQISSETSNRTRNNYKTSLGAIFNVLVHFEYLDKNIVHDIPQLKTTEKRDPTYSDKQVEEITKYLRGHDRVMLMYIYFVSYLFWRPKENCRLKVKDINLEERLITVPTKTQGTKTKMIPELLIEDLKEYLLGAAPEDYVFTPKGPGFWKTSLDNRRDYFSKRYNKIKKELKLDPQFTIYSFRHTFITRAYKSLRKDHSKEKALEKLATITGHTSKAILEYIHVLDAETVEDYSKYLK